MIKNVSVFGLILWALTAHASAATSCPNNNYIAYTLNDARVKAEKNWGAEDLENFDAMIDILVKDSPDCLAAAWSMLIPQVQKAIRLRASEHTDKSNCDVKIDIEDRSWCNPYFRENGATVLNYKVTAMMRTIHLFFGVQPIKLFCRN